MIRLTNEMLTLRAEAIQPILRWVLAGDSCLVVGVGSVGKSNLLRLLQRDDVRLAHVAEAWDNYLFIYIDANKLLKQSLWGLLELMLHQLMIGLSQRGVEAAALQAIDNLHRRATSLKTQYLILRYLDRALDLTCHQLGLRVVFLIDEFDHLGRTIPPRSFAALRALRDDYKYQLMYVVATRTELKNLRVEAVEFEAFTELIASHTIWLGPYSEQDAQAVLHKLEARHHLLLDNQTRQKLLFITGGHPGLLREAYQIAAREQDNLFEALTHSRPVQEECQRIWLSLTPEEQHVMSSLASHAAVQPSQVEIVARLGEKGMLGGPWLKDSNKIFSPLLADFIRRQNPRAGIHIYVDHNRHTVWVAGHEIRGLTPLEYQLLAYLEARRGQVCLRDELARHLYPDDMTLVSGGVTDARLDSVIKRLRKRIEPDPREPRYLITVRGHGLCLVDGEENNL